MRFGLLIPTRGAVMQSARRPPVEDCWTMTLEADRAGWDAVWVGDSVVAKPRLEAMTTLAYMAGITSQVRLRTAVLLPSLRQPVIMAQLLANVDQISKGRLIVGVGVGWSLPSAEAEWAACGMDHKRRARRLEEQIELWRALWSGEPVTKQGAGYKLSEHTIGPLPWNREGPPIWITAGNRGEIYPAQIERFGKMGDGIITTYIEYDECVRLRELGAEALERHGRPNPDFPLCVYTTVRMDDDVATAQRITDEYLATYYGGSRPLANRGGMGLGPADAVIGTFKAYEQAGVTDLCVRFSGADQLSQLERFSEEVLPAFR